MAYIRTDDNNRIVAVSRNFRCGNDDIQVILPDDFDLSAANDWIYSQGEFTYSHIEPEVQVDECAALRSEVDMLTECVLQLSEAVYA